MNETPISEKTKVTLGMVAAIAGGIVWVSTLHANTTENSKTISSLVKKEEEKDKIMTDILIRLARIEGLLTRATR